MIDSRLELAAARVLGTCDLDVLERARFLDSPTGAALLALLCNAAAKTFPALYAEKSLLLRHAIALSGDWWATPHQYGDTYPADTVIYLETLVGRMAFHVKRSDPLLVDVLSTAPTSDRGWDGQSLQSRARELALVWLAHDRYVR